MSKKLIGEAFDIKKLIVKSLFADDDLMNIFVLKGGNAIEIAYKVHSRSSMDMDVSMEKDFEDYDLTLEEAFSKIKLAFERIFEPTEYKVYDFKIEKKPSVKRFNMDKTWGGYCLLFKIIKKESYLENNINLTRKISLPLGKDNKTTFTVDISRFEYTKPKQELDFEDMCVYVYSPLMIINEKLRAICQQMEEYKVSSKHQERARDFFDIYMIFETYQETKEIFYLKKNLEDLTQMFEVKNVPLELLNNIENTYDFHELGYSTLENIVDVRIKLQSFKFYFDYVVDKINGLNSFWIE